jgi:uncharacterized membrane protein
VIANSQLFYSLTDCLKADMSWCEALCGRVTRYCVFSLAILLLWYLEIPTAVLLEGGENHIIAKAVATGESLTNPVLM